MIIGQPFRLYLKSEFHQAQLVDRSYLAPQRQLAWRLDKYHQPSVGGSFIHSLRKNPKELSIYFNFGN